MEDLRDCFIFEPRPYFFEKSPHFKLPHQVPQQQKWLRFFKHDQFLAFDPTKILMKVQYQTVASFIRMSDFWKVIILWTNANFLSFYPFFNWEKDGSVDKCIKVYF